ncbi:MAG: HAD family hydrolase [Akkermansiaceae bacterium]|nr:HAD family hydrolase [Akkermansiaceae bacterium]
MLVLFDIDGTLVDTAGAGMTALVETTTHFFGDPGPELDLAGSTDLGIIRGIHRHFEFETTEETIAQYFEHYEGRLTHQLKHGGFGGSTLPGALELVEHLHQLEAATIGLLTGNTEGGARVKCHHFGFGDYFHFGAYGSDHHDRNQLGPIALERARAHNGREHRVEQTWIIGDTPKDIACAHAFGARCMAVTTGSFDRQQLESHGADLVVDSLEEAASLLRA